MPSDAVEIMILTGTVIRAEMVATFEVIRIVTLGDVEYRHRDEPVLMIVSKICTSKLKLLRLPCQEFRARGPGLQICRAF